MMNFEIPDEYKHLDWNFIAEQLCEAICGSKSQVSLINHDRLNAINSMGSAVYNDKDGNEIVGFNFRNGDWNGTEIFDIEGKAYEPPKPTRYVFVLDESSVKDVEMARKLWPLLKHRFEKKQSEMNYDLYFEPTSKTRQHYEKYAKDNFLKIVLEEQS